MKRAASFTAWGIKATTVEHKLPYIVKIPFIFYSRRAAREWLKNYTDGSVGVPIKIWIQECKEGL